MVLTIVAFHVSFQVAQGCEDEGELIRPLSLTHCPCHFHKSWDLLQFWELFIQDFV